MGTVKVKYHIPLSSIPAPYHLFLKSLMNKTLEVRVTKNGIVIEEIENGAEYKRTTRRGGEST